MNLTVLQGVLPDFIYNELQEVSTKYGINTQNRIANFLGQCDHESAGFKTFLENLNYSGDALWSLFPTHFASSAEANTYARQPEKIANRIYANRMGNSNEASGDGWKYRGKGCIQLTGKSNHVAFFTAAGLNPATTDPMLITNEYALVSAAWFWEGRNLNAAADAGIDTATITNITKIINGGTNGLDDRIAKTQKYFALIA